MPDRYGLGEPFDQGATSGLPNDEARCLQEVAERRRAIGADRGRTKVCGFRIHPEVHLMTKRLARLRGQSVGKLLEERLIYSLTDDEFQGYLDQMEALAQEEAEAAIEAERWDEDELGPESDFESLQRDLDRSLEGAKPRSRRRTWSSP